MDLLKYVLIMNEKYDNVLMPSEAKQAQSFERQWVALLFKSSYGNLAWECAYELLHHLDIVTFPKMCAK